MIKILKLANNLDIIGDVSDLHSGQYTIIEPIVFEMSYRGNQPNINMDTFLPVILTKENQVILSDKDILCIVQPTEEFMNYYSNFVEGLRGVMDESNAVKTKEIISQEIMINILENMDEHDGRPIQ